MLLPLRKMAMCLFVFFCSNPTIPEPDYSPIIIRKVNSSKPPFSKKSCDKRRNLQQLLWSNAARYKGSLEELDQEEISPDESQGSSVKVRDMVDKLRSQAERDRRRQKNRLRGNSISLGLAVQDLFKFCSCSVQALFKFCSCSVEALFKLSSSSDKSLMKIIFLSQNLTREGMKAHHPDCPPEDQLPKKEMTPCYRIVFLCCLCPIQMSTTIG